MFLWLIARVDVYVFPFKKFYVILYMLHLLNVGMGWLRSGNSTLSVVYSSYLEKGSPNPCSNEVVQWLTSGTHPIHRLIVGHQPNADCPSTLDLSDLQVIRTLFATHSMFVF